MGHERFRSSHFKEQWVVSLQKAIRPLCESGGLTEPKDLEDFLRTGRYRYHPLGTLV